MDNIVIGQYIPGNSLIHKMDPRMKIVLLIILIATLFVAHTIIEEAILLVLSIVLVIMSRIPFIKVIKGLRAIAFLLLFTAVLQLAQKPTDDLTLILNPITMNMTLWNLLIAIGLLLLFIFTKKFMPFKILYFLILCTVSLALQYHFIDGKLLFDYNIRIYKSGLIKTGFVVLRIFNLVILSSLLTFTTSPMDLKNGLESLMKPLKVIKVPVGEIAMMLSLVLRFIPTLLDETNKIIKAQASRGVDFKESGFRQKINQIISLLVPMFVVSFKRADDLANAMESRGYVIGEARTNIDVMKLHVKDYIALVFVLIILSAAIVALALKIDLWQVITCA